MNAALQKEVRLLLPSWALALGAVIVPPMLASVLVPAESLGGITSLCFFAAALILSLAPFGQEIQCGTFGLMLSQPESRRRIWCLKVSLAAAAMASIYCVAGCLLFWVVVPSARLNEMLTSCALIATSTLSGALWTTLLFRQTTTAFWVTLILPLIVGALAEWAGPGTMVPAYLIYSAAGFILAWRLFLRAQDIPWTGGIVSLSRQPAMAVPWTGQRRSSMLRSLLRKEMRLQQVTLFLVPCLLALHLLSLLARKVNPDFARKSLFANLVWILMARDSLRHRQRRRRRRAETGHDAGPSLRADPPSQPVLPQICFRAGHGRCFRRDRARVDRGRGPRRRRAKPDMGGGPNPLHFRRRHSDSLVLRLHARALDVAGHGRRLHPFGDRLFVGNTARGRGLHDWKLVRAEFAADACSGFGPHPELSLAGLVQFQKDRLGRRLGLQHRALGRHGRGGGGVDLRRLFAPLGIPHAPGTGPRRAAD